MTTRPETSIPARSPAPETADTSRGAPPDATRRRFAPPVGPIDGWVDGDLVRATGIRYADAGRFEVPRPVPDHEEPIEATRWSPSCPQNYEVAGDELFSPLRRDLGVDEHCQRLSVLAPADAPPDAGLPVVVWIHGGSYLTGTGDSSITDPGQLVREQGVVAVTITYRLGALGYIGTHDRAANLGLLDQAEALRWVRRNIGAFGGDVGRITVIGESAGADAIAHLLAAFPDEPLADRAILQSPPLGIRSDRSRMTAAVSRIVASLDAESSHEELLAAERPVHRRSARYGMVGTMPFGVQYGHDPMPEESEIEAAWRRVAPHVPVMIGTMGTEFTLFTRQSRAARRLERSAFLEHRLLEPIERWGSRTVFTRGADEFARLWADAGGAAWRYEIPWSAPGNRYRSPHGLDVILQFGGREVWEDAGVSRGSRWEDFAHAGRVLRSVWGAFAHGRDPGPGEAGIIEIVRVRDSADVRRGAARPAGDDVHAAHRDAAQPGDEEAPDVR